jgi:diacylglycerol kinase (ATP)
MLVIINPVSANGATEKRWPALHTLLQQRHTGPLEIRFTERPGHAAEIAATAAGREAVICVGGDGTLNEIVNGLMRIDAAQRPALAMVPSGTGSDFARALGVPQDPAAAVAAFSSTHVQSIDVGEIACMDGRALRTRFFVNVTGLGFDADVAEEIARAGERGRKGKAVYFLSVFRTLGKMRSRHMRITLMPDARGEQPRILECRSSLIAVCNGRFFGGGMHIAPHADPSDGSFDVVLLDSMGRVEFLANFLRVYRGTHLTHPKVRTARASALRIEQVTRDGHPVRLQAEGELLGEAPVSIRMAATKVKFLTPVQLDSNY